eukprot:230031-Pyramimonas_sp.AAC.1
MPPGYFEPRKCGRNRGSTKCLARAEVRPLPPHSRRIRITRSKHDNKHGEWPTHAKRRQRPQ